MAALPPSLLVKQTNLTVDYIESYVTEMVSKYLSYGIPVHVEYYESIRRPLSIAAGQFVQKDGSMIVQIVNYMSDSDGSEESQLMLQHERDGTRIITLTFLMNVFHGVVIIRRYKVDITKIPPTSEIEQITVCIIGKKFERVKRRLASMSGVTVVTKSE